jgi:hypothetical protein
MKKVCANINFQLFNAFHSCKKKSFESYDSELLMAPLSNIGTFYFSGFTVFGSTMYRHSFC